MADYDVRGCRVGVNRISRLRLGLALRIRREVEKGIEERGFPAVGRAEDVGLEDGARGWRGGESRLLVSRRSFSGFGYCEGTGVVAT